MKDFIEIIKDNAKNYPNRIAIIDRDRRISYNDLILLVNSFSNQLNTRAKVIIDLEQGIEAYALILAVLNVGGTYCPLSPFATLERKKEIINDFSPDQIIVSTEKKAIELNSIKVTVIDSLLNISNNTEIKRLYNDEDIIYIIYTSGSTGISKGVKICRKALNKFLEWSIPTYGANENDIWGQFSFLSFDLSIVDIFTCLCSGATLYAMNEISSKTYRPDRLIENVKITIWHSVPSAVGPMIKNNKHKSRDFSSLKLMSFCGETLKKDQVEFLLLKNNNLRIFNTYGPTEGTLFCTWEELDAKNYVDKSLYSMSIGKAIPGWNIQLNSIDGFEDKEITIYGNYIGKGYLNIISDNKFKKITIDNKEAESFETGDLVKEIEGNLYFSSRKDRQVQIKGFRVELDEIDFRINKFLNLPSVTLVNNDILYSFIETTVNINENDLRSHLTKVLEDYKIPNKFYIINEFPRNQNLKIDNKALKEKLNE